MSRIEDIGAFNTVRETGLAKLLPAAPRIAVGMGTCGRGNGGEAVYHALGHAIERDGMGIRLWQKAGYRFGLITVRSSHIVKMRVAELGIEIIRQGADDKLATTREILSELGLEPRQACYIGDDLPDLPVVATVGLGVAVADACAELRRAAQFVTTRAGGAGAVRETIEMILQAQRRWDDMIQSYL